MSTLTLLGTSGGAGVTTLTALSTHLMIARGARLPRIESTRRSDIVDRLGTVPAMPTTSQDVLVDGGRYRLSVVAEALGRGAVVLVGADTRHGLKALESALGEIGAQFGEAGRARVLPLACASFGTSVSHRGSSLMRIPFDRALAPGTGVSAAMPRLSRAMHGAIDTHWTPVLLATFAQP